jgi:hypothetical protein
MRVKIRVAFAAAVELIASAAVPVATHHSFAAEFDRSKPVTVAGTVAKVEWLNPHARVYVDVTEASGQVVSWDFELGPPNVLMRWGWSRKTLQPGDFVTVSGFRARNAAHVANATTIVLGDGRSVLTGSSASTDTGR